MGKNVMKKTLSATEWLGSNICDHCKNECGEVLYDARTKFGPWATLCSACFPEIGLSTKMGLGLGQRYRKNNEGTYILDV